MRDHSEESRIAGNRQEPYIFISSAYQDAEMVHAFIRSLCGKYRVFYDEHIRCEGEWAETIGEQISSCALFMVFLSASAQKSRFIADEIQYACRSAKQILAVYLEPIKLNRHFDILLERFNVIQVYNEASPESAFAKIQRELPAETRIDSDYPVSEKEERRFLYSDLFDEHACRSLGRGGMGKIHTTRSRKTGAEYAVKVFNRERGAHARNELQNMLFFNEKSFTPAVIDYFEEADGIRLVMTEIEGLDLGVILRTCKDRLTTRRAVTVISRIARIVKEIHDSDMVFGDIKPSNFMLNHLGQLFIVDLGSIASLDDCNCLRVYTPRYAAPEQKTCRHGPPDLRYDIYALGILFRELIDFAESFGQEESATDRETLSNSQLNLLSRTICAKMTQMDPARRYSSMGEVLSALEVMIDWDTEQEMMALYPDSGPGGSAYDKRPTIEPSTDCDDGSDATMKDNRENPGKAGESLFIDFEDELMNTVYLPPQPLMLSPYEDGDTIW